MQDDVRTACYQPGYPRPQLVRNEWINLNGEWDFCFDDENIGYECWPKYGLPQKKVKILVPYTYETKASGIGDEKTHSVVWYERSFAVNIPDCDGGKVLLHFEGCDYLTTVWLNGEMVGDHAGGYERFTFDITRFLHADNNLLTVRVEDRLCEEQPRGKQRWMQKSYACWYVQTTGIWKTVWLEQVPREYVEQLKITPEIKNESVAIEVELCSERERKEIEIETEIFYHGRLVASERTRVFEAHASFCIRLHAPDLQEQWGIHLWSPEHPDLYDVTVHVLEQNQTIDKIGSYFGMREIETKGTQVLLNGKPIYQKLILNQGYWKDTHLTPPSEAAIVKDIAQIKNFGYNGMRIHQKVEDERFLYWCDVKGMLVWCEMPSSYQFSDTSIEKTTSEWLQIVRQNYNHPSIIVWVPFNESWGVPQIRRNITQQHFTEAIYYLTKSIDTMRPVISNDGWEHTISDILTLHNYEEDGLILKKYYEEHQKEILNGELPHCKDRYALAEGYSYVCRPVIISEFGGIAFVGKEDGWGYGEKVEGEQQFLNRFRISTEAIQDLAYVCGYCYTQFTDVQQEANGLLDENREEKVTPDSIRHINDRRQD